MSSRSPTARTDGSAAADAVRRVEIDTTNAAERWRYRCPRGHRDWAPTNNHVWCKGCRRQAETGEEVDPEWYKLVDAKTDRSIPWSAVQIIE